MRKRGISLIVLIVTIIVIITAIGFNFFLFSFLFCFFIGFTFLLLIFTRGKFNYLMYFYGSISKSNWSFGISTTTLRPYIPEFV